jgi:hypothetical protein
MNYLIDIDGVLADVRGLLPLIQGNPKEKDFNTYYARILEAPPIESGVEIVRGLKTKGMPYVFLTGRNEQCREATKQWLHNLFNQDNAFPIFDKDLLMRSEGDRRPAWVVKRDKAMALLETTHTSPKQWVAIDDHAQNIAMFRELGMTTLHVQSDASFSE